ncbi:MAG: glycerol-3-phosphate cytidylyltransferase [Tenericutes bacterium]|nr:glycerol-3-phosphate cytidylyltransferase [Mycoplasmatota bacterium]
MKKIITYGTFDLFHVGHVNILKRAKELGDYLVVGLSTDEFNSLKGKQSYYPYSERKLILEAIKYVDEVIPEENWEQKVDDIKKHNIDVLVMGDDWEGSDRFNYLKEYVELIFLPITENISTSKIKYELQNDKNKK